MELASLRHSVRMPTALTSLAWIGAESYEAGPCLNWNDVGARVRKQWDNATRSLFSWVAMPPSHCMNAEETLSPQERATLEVTLPTALELCRLGLATMIDIRQSFEVEMKGAIPDTVHIPMFEVKVMLGHTLTEDEQDILDAGQPKDIDAKTFFTMINQLHHERDHLLLCVCNSGRRSLTAASLLRSLGYPKALSVAGGFQAWKKLQATAGAPAS